MASKRFSIAAEPRADVGKGASRRLRRSGKVPAIMYGGGQAPASVLLDRNEIMRNAEQEAFLSSILTVRLDGQELQAVVRDVQVHPARRQILHMDLQRILADEKLRMTVPLHFLNEANAKGVKESGGIVSHLMTEIEVSCLPRDLPEYLELDIGELGLNEVLHLSDIKLPPGVEIPELAGGPENDRPVVSIHVVKEEVEVVPEAEVAAAEVPATAQTAEAAAAEAAAKEGKEGKEAPKEGGKEAGKEPKEKGGKEKEKK
jgi:large subunit ribosomal protein L25